VSSGDEQPRGRRSESGSATGGVPVGAFTLHPTAAGGTRLYRVAAGTADPTPLRLALEPAAPVMRQVATGGIHAAEAAQAPADEREQTLEEAEDVTARVEEAMDLITAILDGRVVDVASRLDDLFNLAERWHLAGRYEDEIRLARPLAVLLCLTLRWIMLAMLLRRVLAAARALADTHAAAWAVHELGTLAVASGDELRGRALLERARDQRIELEDTDGIASTKHNLEVTTTIADADVRSGGRGRVLSLTQIAVAICAAILLSVVGVAIAKRAADKPHPGAAPIASGSSGTIVPPGSGQSSHPPSDGSSGPPGSSRPPPPPPPPIVGAIRFRSTPISPTNHASPSFAFSATNASGYRCKLDSQPVESCDSGRFGSSTPLADGGHTLVVWGVAGSTEGPKGTFGWTIDTAPPVITGLTCAVASSCSYSITGSPGEALNPPECQLIATLTGAQIPISTCTSGSATFGTLSQGLYTFTVRDTDPAGNEASRQTKFNVVS